MEIRNFSIIAHIDHGKSTLADRLLELTGAITEREMKEQFLDGMDIERERGITIKAQTARLEYTGKDGSNYILNLIDTPGHVDFSYEVSRSLAACEGAILVVDATQGIEAQTLANTHLALDNDLVIIPVINKIDLPAADIDSVAGQIEEVIGISADEIIPISAKEGIGVGEVLEAIVKLIPSPGRDKKAVPRALLLDSWYDSFKGVVALVRVVDGVLKRKDIIKFMATGAQHEIDRMGVFTPKEKDVESLEAGEVGFFTASIRAVADAKVGDTITLAKNGASESLPGFSEIKPMVFSGLYPVDGDEYEKLRDALGKLKLNDSSFYFEPETSIALGFGFRCGFLGLLHMGIIRERLEREFYLTLISTAPSVVYKVTLTNGDVVDIDNPAKLVNPNERQGIAEPVIEATIICPEEYIGAVMTLARERRGVQKKIEYLSTSRAQLVFHIPLNEVVLDFFDRLKSVTRGYASMDYEFYGYSKSDLSKLDLLVNGEMVDTLSMIVHKDKAYAFGRDLTDRETAYSPPDVRHIDPGGHRRKNHQPDKCKSIKKKRSGQMLRRGRYAKTETSGKTERRQKEDEKYRQGGDTARGFSRHAQNG